jgi:hypothetical protein
MLPLYQLKALRWLLKRSQQNNGVHINNIKWPEIRQAVDELIVTGHVHQEKDRLYVNPQDEIVLNGMFSGKNLNAVLPYAFAGEYEWFEHQALHMLAPNDRVYMLGAGPGIMSLALLENNPYLDLTAIDCNGETLRTYKAHLDAAVVEAHTMCLLTQQAKDRLWTGAKLIVVDADHSYQAVRGDIINYWPLLAPGGLMFFHDWVDTENNGTNGVQGAVRDALTREMSDAELETYVGISVVYRKKNNA